MEAIANSSADFSAADFASVHSVHASQEDRYRLMEGESQDTSLANLKFAILVIASKCTIVLAISTVVRSILFFQPSHHSERESALVFGLMVELLFENTEGFFVLLIVLSLFDTQWSKLVRRLKVFHREARSRIHSLHSPGLEDTD